MLTPQGDPFAVNSGTNAGSSLHRPHGGRKVRREGRMEGGREGASEKEDLQAAVEFY